MPTYPIQIKRSGTAASAPSSLAHGELALNYADKVLYFKDASNVIQSFTFQSYALASHTHAASDITSGTLDAARLPLATTLAAGAVIVGTGLGVSSGTVSVTYGTTSGTACQGNDSRLSDARTPTSHAHGNISNAGAIGATANLPVITTTSGVLTTGTFGTSASSFCEGNDARLSDTRTPTDNTVSTAKIQNDAVTYAKIQNVSATDRLLGRSSAGAGDVEEITCTSFGRSLISSADAPAARTTLSVQPTASPTFTGTAIVSGTFQVKANSGSLSHAFGYNENGGEISLYTTSEVQASLIDHVGGTGTRVLELVNGNDLYLGLGSGNTTGNVKIQRAGYVTAVTVSSTGTATFEGQVLVTAGSGSSGSYKPGMAISGDDDTGIHQVSGNANTLSIVTNGTERVRVDASGAVGIGMTPTSLPLSAFSFATSDANKATLLLSGTVGSGQSFAGIRFSHNVFTTGWGADILCVDTGNFGGILSFRTSATGSATATPTERVRVDASGNVGIGIAPSTQLHVGSLGVFRLQTGSVTMDCTPTAGALDGFVWNTNPASYYQWNTGGTQRLLIGSDGKITCKGLYDNTVGATNRDVFVDSGGVVGYVSSIRESKTDIASLDDVSWLSALSPVSYRYRKRNADGTYSDEADGVTDYGLIAEDVEAVRPELCFYDMVDGEPQLRGVTYSKLITPMLKYIQQLEARIAALEERING